MALTASTFRASASWTLTKSNTGFTATTNRDDLSASYTADVATLTEALIARYTLAAAGTQTIDLYSFTDIVGNAVTATKFGGILLVATASVTGGTLKIEPGGSNPFDLGLAGTTPSISLNVGTTGATFMVRTGTNGTLSSSARNILLTNSGSQSITVDVFALVGA